MLTWVYRDLFKSLPWVLFSVPLWSGMRDCMVILCLPLEEPPNCFPQPLWHFTYPPATQEGSSFFTSLPTFSSWPCQWVWCVKSKVNQLYIHTHVYAVDELHLTLCSPRRVACQAPLSVGFFRQEYWSGLPFPPRRNLPNPRMEPESLKSPALVGGFFTTEPPGKPFPLTLISNVPFSPVLLCSYQFTLHPCWGTS